MISREAGNIGQRGELLGRGQLLGKAALSHTSHTLGNKVASKPILMGPPRGSLYLIGEDTRVRNSSEIKPLSEPATKKGGKSPAC